MIDIYNSEHYLDLTAFQALTNIDHDLKAYRPLVYVCSPLAGDIQGNIMKARKYSRFVVDQGCIPLAPHLLFPQFLDDGDAFERQLGMVFGNVLLKHCESIWVFGDRISNGMVQEIKRAKWACKPIRYIKGV